jgi:hypothetical protein
MFLDAEMMARGGVGLGLLPLVVDRAALRAGHFFGDVTDEFLERRNGGSVEVRSGDADVGVEISNGVRQMIRVILRPFRRANQPFLFRIPGAEDDPPLRLPSGLE